jgi:hypothetical protein
MLLIQSKSLYKERESVVFIECNKKNRFAENLTNGPCSDKEIALAVQHLVTLYEDDKLFLFQRSLNILCPLHYIHIVVLYILCSKNITEFWE